MHCEAQVDLYILTASAMVENTDSHRSGVLITAHNITLDHELSSPCRQRSLNSKPSNNTDIIKTFSSHYSTFCILKSGFKSSPFRQGTQHNILRKAKELKKNNIIHAVGHPDSENIYYLLFLSRQTQ